MLKKFVLMIIVAFTLQLSWAVASAYCMHETDKTAQHFGHHPHEHEAKDGDTHADKSLDKSAAKKANSHPDCASCAHSPLGAHSSKLPLTVSALITYQLTAASLQTPAPFLAQPERPKWMAFA
ncbi:MAG: hypothetical protein HY254_19145 [Burkholderiales bacterium]|nr:hypothetical protein [Burkholderiales bacterium]